MYDPKTGRLTQTDPIAGNRAFKQYIYGSNNPLLFVDYLGLQDTKISRYEPPPWYVRWWRYAIGSFGWDDSMEGHKALAFKDTVSQSGGHALLEPVLIIDDAAQGACETVGFRTREKIFNENSSVVNTGINLKLKGYSDTEVYWELNKEIHKIYWLGRFLQRGMQETA
jgi:hypothetical protein